MAGKKKEGLDGMKDTTGGKKREDRASIGKNIFDPLSVDAKNVVTVMYMLQSPEEYIKLRCVASLELYGRRDQKNLEILHSIGVLPYILPLCDMTDNLIKRFTLKLIGMLSILEEFRVDLMKEENILEKFLNILQKESDCVLQEYSSLTLSRLALDYQVASDLLRLSNCLETLFERITSLDPDIEKNCLEIMNTLLNDIHGVEIFVESSSFNIKDILNLVLSSYAIIQQLAIEVLIQLTLSCKDPSVIFLFCENNGLETFMQVLNNKEWKDLHLISYDIILNVANCPDVCEYLLQSGCLENLISLLSTEDDDKVVVEKIIGILARVSQTKRGQEVLHAVEVEKKFIEYISAPQEGIQEAACLGLANLTQNMFSRKIIVEAKPMKALLGILLDNEKNSNLKCLAAYAMNILCNADKKASEDLMEDEDYKGLFPILTDSPNLTTEFCQNVIQMFIGISFNHELKSRIIDESFLSALISCLPLHSSASKEPSVQVEALDCLSEYLTESEARAIFLQLNGHEAILKCLQSKLSFIREWAGYLLLIVSQEEEFVKKFIQIDGLDWMLKEKNTMYSMPSWQSAIEAIFSAYLPAKFAYTGRLDFQDITEDGFFISTNPNSKFVVLDVYIKTNSCPVFPMYVSFFNPPRIVPRVSTVPEQLHSKDSFAETIEPQNLKKFMRGAARDSLEDNLWAGSLNSYPSVDYDEIEIREIYHSCSFSDPNLRGNLENLKRRIEKEEINCGHISWACIHPQLVCNRARIIAEFVAEEMSGIEPESSCNAISKWAHLNELKCFMGTSMFPLGVIRTGDYLERAMMFKVLADRIGFPCALVRGLYGRAWIEIAVPVVNVESFKEQEKKQESFAETEYTVRSSEITVDYKKVERSVSERSMLSFYPESEYRNGFLSTQLHMGFFKGFPTKFLKPNAIVDLVKEPGRLLNIDSVEADEYCGAFLFQES